MEFHQPFSYPHYNPNEIDQWLYTSALHYTYQRVTRLMLPPTQRWTDDGHISMRRVLRGSFTKHILVFYRPLYKTIMFTNCLEDDFQTSIGYYGKTQYLTRSQLSWVLYLVVRTLTWALDCALEPPRRFILLSNDRWLRYYFQNYMTYFDNTPSSRHMYEPTPGENREADRAWLYHRMIPELQVVCDYTDQSQLPVHDRAESLYEGSQLTPDCNRGRCEHPLVEAGEQRWIGGAGSDEILSWLADLHISPQPQLHQELPDPELPPPEIPDLHPPAPYQPSPYAVLLYPGSSNPQAADQRAMSQQAPAGLHLSSAQDRTPWVRPMLNFGLPNVSRFPSVAAAPSQAYGFTAGSQVPLNNVTRVRRRNLASTGPASRVRRGAVNRRKTSRSYCAEESVVFGL